MTKRFTLPATGPLLATESDATDLIGELYGHNAELVVIPVSRLKPEVFRLSNSLLGLFLQHEQSCGPCWGLIEGRATEGMGPCGAPTHSSKSAF